MKFGKKEIKALLFLVGLIYLYAFYLMNFKGAFPSISELRPKVMELEKKLAQLENDYADLENKKRALNFTKTANLRYSDFISNNSEVVDSIDYVERLKKLFNNKITAVSFSTPTEKKDNGLIYYEFTIAFKSNLTLAEINQISNYIDSGTKKVSISKFDINAKGQSNANGAQTQQGDIKSAELDVNLAISTYSLEKGNSERFYDVSKNKFEKFISGDGIVFSPISPDKEKLTNTIKFTQAEGGKPNSLPSFKKDSDISIYLKSYLIGGPNISSLSLEENTGKYLTIYGRSKVKQSFVIKLNNSNYSVDLYNESGTNSSYTGVFPGRDMKILIDSDIPNIRENRNLYADIRIINNSDFKIGLSVLNNKSRIKILGRDGNNQLGELEKEKIIQI